MKKNAIIILAAVSTIALCLALIPNVSSQIENVNVLSYNGYMSPYSSDSLIVVGEAQNTGPNVIDYVIVTGTFYAPDGTVFMSNYIKTLTTQILPQQKTPFYLTFSPANIVSGTIWESADVTNYTITVTVANPTDARQYQDLTITSHSASTDTDGYYMVTGTVKNTGSQATNQTWVVATFYNSTGSVVAVGYNLEPLTPASSIPAGGTASFTIYPADYAYVSGSIASYSLIIQTKLTAPSATPTPTPSPSPSTSPTPTPSSSASPTPTASGNGTAIPEMYVYAAVAIVAIIVVVGVVALVLKKRASKRAAVSPVKEMDKETQPPQ